MIVGRSKIAPILAGTLALAACSSGPSRVRSAPAPTAAPTAETDAVFDLLMRGDQVGARKKLTAVLKRDPMNSKARLLSDSIDRDPKELLGPQSYPYTAHAGDTVVGLAERFLGNRLKAYQLLRYNDLKAPAILSAGQVLRIPGEPPRPEPVRAEPVRRAEPAPVRATSTTSKPKPPAPKPATNPGAARQVRAAGLAALNQGNVDRAVGLLRRATALDPGNAMIARDLSRAERIAATVKSRK